MQFSDIIGQISVKEKLAQLVNQNRLSHALLFLGKEGCGDLPLAMAFAQFIVCKASKEAGKADSTSLFENSPDEAPPTRPSPGITNMLDSCGICPACQKSSKLVHPDIHFSFPVINKKPGEKPVSTDFIKDFREFVASYPYGNVYDWLQFIGAENKQGNISAEECNDINRKLSLKSFESKNKILIMWLPEYLGKEGNKLLKLIEEPPPDTIFIFVSENEQNIIPTILSRTQLIKIPALTANDIEEALSIRAKVDPIKSGQLAAIAGGNYREALQLLQHAEQDWQEVAREWLKIINRQQISEQLKWIDEISKLGREKQKQFLIYFIHLCEQAIRFAFINLGSNNSETINNKQAINQSETDFSMRLNKLCTVEAQAAIIEELNKACYYIERNAHAKMLFHALSIRLYKIIKDNSLILIN